MHTNRTIIGELLITTVVKQSKASLIIFAMQKRQYFCYLRTKLLIIIYSEYLNHLGLNDGVDES